MCLQDGGFHLDMVYITENIMALGFPGTENSPNILGFKEVCFLKAFQILLPWRWKVVDVLAVVCKEAGTILDDVRAFEAHPLSLVVCVFSQSNYQDNIEELITFCETQHPVHISCIFCV